jgi:DNA-binding transcriptional MerR regulator
MRNEWSIHEVAQLTGTTSRTLRHYAQIGLLAPSRTAANGYRHYDAAALTRLQRILLLRDLGLGLPAIGEVLRGTTDDAVALAAHLRWLRDEKDRIDRQIVTVEATVSALKKGEQLMAENMFDGFDHTQYKQEVEERWGSEAYASGDAWWRAMNDEQKARWMSHQRQLATDWSSAASTGAPADGPEAQALAQRQFDWLAGIPGTPRATSTTASSPARPSTTAVPSGPSKEYFVGLAEMYVADERFAVNYGGIAGATFVRDAMRIYADRNL